MSLWTRTREIISSFGKPESKAKAALPLAVGLLLTGAAIFLATRRISALESDFRSRTAFGEIVVASGAIPTGTTLSEIHMAKRSIPLSGITRRHVKAGEFGLLVGAVTRASIDGGEPILYTDVEEPLNAEKLSLVVPEGSRALTLDVDATSSFAGLVRPGDRLDFHCASGVTGRSAEWIRNIAVIAVGHNYQSSPSKEEGSEISTITLSVRPGEGTRLATAARNGELHWFLRNPGDNTVIPTPAAKAAANGPIEVWKGGIRTDARRRIREEADGNL